MATTKAATDRELILKLQKRVAALAAGLNLAQRRISALEDEVGKLKK